MKKAIVVLPAVASILIVAIVIILLWMAGSASGERAKFSSLGIAPKEADIFVAVNTDPTSPQWLAVDASLDAINAKDPIRRAIDEALAEVNLNFEEDILPVAGDEAFFSVPDVEKVDQGGYLAGFRLSDRGKARELFDSLRQRAADDGEDLNEEEYEGVTIYYTEGPGFDFDSLSGSSSSFMSCSGSSDDTQQCFCEDENGTRPAERDGDNGWTCRDTSLEESRFLSPGGAVALFDDVLALGGSPDDVKMVIDVAQGRAPTAEENERLQEFRAIQKEEFLVWGYADMGSMWDVLEDGLATSLGTGGGSGYTLTPEPEPTPPPETGFSILSFDAEYQVLDGALNVTERITIDFGDTPKHGIYRDVSTRVNYDFINDALITIGNVSATRDGATELFEEQPISEDHHRIKIGDPNVTMTGQHTYEIQYVATGAIIPNGFGTGGLGGDPNDSYEVVWNVTGDGWGVPIEKASATLTVPDGELSFHYCFLEGDPFADLGENPACGSTEANPQTVRFDASEPVEPGFGLRFFVNVEGQVSAPPPVLVPSDFFDDFGEQPDEPAFPFNFNSEELIGELRGTYDRVGFSVSATGDGFALDLTVLHAPDFEPTYALEPGTAFDSHFAGAAPEDTMLFFAGYDLYGQFKALGDYLDQIGFADGEAGDDFLDGFTDATGLDLEDDVFSLLTGEYAVAGNVSGFEDDPPDFNVTAMLDVNDPAKAQKALDAIGDFLQDEGLIDVDDSGAIDRWKPVDEPGVDAIGVTVDGNALIVGYPDGAVEDSAGGIDRSLADTDDWKRTLDLLPQETTSIGFLSLARIFEELRGTDAGRSFDESTDGELTLEDLAAIRSIGIATTSRENGFGTHIVIFMEDR